MYMKMLIDLHMHGRNNIYLTSRETFKQRFLQIIVFRKTHTAETFEVSIVIDESAFKIR